MWGPDVGKRYVERVDVLIRARDLAHLRTLRALNLRALLGVRSGQFAINLTGRMRLIIGIEDERRTAVIEEVVDYHG